MVRNHPAKDEQTLKSKEDNQKTNAYRKYSIVLWSLFLLVVVSVVFLPALLGAAIEFIRKPKERDWRAHLILTGKSAGRPIGLALLALVFLPYDSMICLDALLRSVAGLLVDGGRLAIADLDEDPDGAFHADKADFDGHHGFNREQLAARLGRSGFVNVSFVDATTLLRGDRPFSVFLCTATKGA